MADILCPVFCTADLPVELVDKFFQEANEVTKDGGEEWPMGYLVTTEHISSVQATTSVPDDALTHNPFRDKTPKEVVRWALDNPHPSLAATQMIILDSQTAEDNTCLLLSLKQSRPDPPGLGEDWLAVRSDFMSSIVTIMAKEMGTAGNERFETSPFGGYEGVLRLHERYAAEAAEMLEIEASEDSH